LGERTGRLIIKQNSWVKNLFMGSFGRWLILLRGSSSCSWCIISHIYLLLILKL
jgi:hypothetical protein